MKSKLIAIFILALLYSPTEVLHCAAETSPTSQSSQDKNKSELPTIRDLMEQHIHPEFTAMSFTIWHDQPLTSAKMDRVAHSARQIITLASSLKAYSVSMPEQGWNSQDVAFFNEKRLQLSAVAAELERAARRRDRESITSFFLHLDFTCHSCHMRFRPGIS